MDPKIFSAFSHPSFKSKTVPLKGIKRDHQGSGVVQPYKRLKVLEKHKFQFL
jgi:hypothetical protein